MCNVPDSIREWMEEALDLLEQPGLEYTNRERRAEAITNGYILLDSLPTAWSGLATDETMEARQ